MTVRVALLGLWLLFALSLAVLGVFLFFVDPAYLAFSGFLFFYAVLFAWLWSVFVLAGYFAFGRRRRTFPAGWPRRSALLALLAAATIFFQHMHILSVYTLLGLVLAAGGMEYYSIKRKQ